MVCSMSRHVRVRRRHGSSGVVTSKASDATSSAAALNSLIPAGVDHHVVVQLGQARQEFGHLRPGNRCVRGSGGDGPGTGRECPAGARAS